MRAGWALLLYVGAVFIGGALLAPWLYWGAESAGLLNDSWRPSFSRFVTRSFLFVALVGIWPLLRYSRLNSWRAVGITRANGWRGNVSLGALIGIGSLGVVAAGALASRARSLEIHPDLPSLPLMLLGALATATIVSVIEEILFRGVIFSVVRHSSPEIIAVFISSAIYSIVHFFQKVSFRPSNITWTSGLELLPPMLRGFTDWQQIIPGFLVLFLAGAVLAIAYQRTGSLYLSIGLHAGWIFFAQSYAILTRGNPNASTAFWGGAKMIDGWCAFAALLPLLVWVWRSPTTVNQSPGDEHVESLTRARL